MNSQFNTRNLPELLTLGECVALARDSDDADFLAGLVLGRLLPSYRQRLELRNDLTAALQGLAPPTRDELLALRRNWRVNRGALLLDRPPGSTAPEPGPADDPVYFPESWAPDPVNATYIRRFLKLAETRGIPVFWVIPPIRPDVQAKREALGLDARYEWFVRRAAERFPTLTVLDGRRSGFSRDLFVDLSHLEARGAAPFSMDVGQGLAASLAHPQRNNPGLAVGTRAGHPGSGVDLANTDTRGRWVALPPYRDRPIPGPLEDIAGSRLALDLERTRGGLRR